MRPLAYTEKWTVSPGEKVRIAASGQGRARASLVRLSGLVGAPLPAAYLEHAIADLGDWQLEQHAVPMGSFARADPCPVVATGASWRWTLRMLPTLVDSGTVLDWGGVVRLSLVRGQLVAEVGSSSAAVPVSAGDWWEVALAGSASGLSLTLAPIAGNAWLRKTRRADAPGCNVQPVGSLVLGTGFNGKIEAPALEADGLPVASWDLATDMQLQRIRGIGSAAADLVLVNAPRRAVTSSAWTGEHHDWRSRPDHYAAIHVHDDDLADCGWPATLEAAVPEDAASGIYAVRIESEGGTSHVPLFVRPRRCEPVAFLASTFSYLAYGNSVWASAGGQPRAGAGNPDAELATRSGRSTYCRHRDGSGIGLVSTRRPILSFTPGFLGEALGSQVLLNDDLRIIRWLEQSSIDHCVITDHDLHSSGAATLDGCRVLVTGTHPEYHSRESLDAIAGFTARGGRLIYLGGNGFYWRVSFLADAPHVMELRRAEGGVRKWAEPAGEYHHQSDGGLGGLWRRLGRPPNSLVGIGYSAQGQESATRAYRRLPASEDARARFLFAGVAAQTFGHAGPVGAAAGYELDRADPRLGTPGHALIVARSEPFGPETHPVNEERLTPELHDAEDPIRADMVFYEGPAGGAVLSVGSVLFATRLEEHDGAGRVISNALRRFADPEPFQLPGAGATAAPDPIDPR